MTRSQMKFSTL